MIENHALNLMRAGKPAFGFGANHLRSMATPLLAEAAGFDWLFIDLEHGTMTIEQACQISVAAIDAGIEAIRRTFGVGCSCDAASGLWALGALVACVRRRRV